MEPIFRHAVHSQSIWYSLTRSAQIIFNFYLARIEYSRKVRKLVTCQVSSFISVVYCIFTSYREHAAFPKLGMTHIPNILEHSHF